MGGVDPRSGKERGMGGEGDRGGAGETGEPVHDMDKERVHDCEQGGSGGTPLLETFPGEDAHFMS
eukprot:9719436-Prorocentrum_lima.AAC.1